MDVATLGGVRLAVVIPALNEAATIGSVVAGVPRSIPAVGIVDVIVVDDGSSDGTGDRARAAGADEVVRHPRSRGLAAAFNLGMAAALRRGAEVVVQLDGDGQHDPAYVPALIAPVLTGQADMAVGVRALRESDQGERFRRLSNRFGSQLLGKLLRLEVSDFTSGYRAYTRDALLRLNVVYNHSYTLETLAQASCKRLAVAEVPIRVSERTHGVSRMTHSLGRYIARALGHTARTVLHDDPLRVFMRATAITGTLAIATTAWFLISYAGGGLHLPILLAALLLVMATGALGVCGLLADGISLNRRLIEDTLMRVRKMELRDAAGEPPRDAQLPAATPAAELAPAVPLAPEGTSEIPVLNTTPSRYRRFTRRRSPAPANAGYEPPLGAS
jgi:hypothetical protein